MMVTLTMIVTVAVIEFVAVQMAGSVTIGIHLYFRVSGWGKERGL
jgi:hypothetical protein